MIICFIKYSGEVVDRQHTLKMKKKIIITIGLVGLSHISGEKTSFWLKNLTYRKERERERETDRQTERERKRETE